LSAVLDAVRNGADQRQRIAEVTGLPRDVVDSAIEHLVRSGRLTAQDMAVGCPPSGCGTCSTAGTRACSDQRSPGLTMLVLAPSFPRTSTST
jgi:bacterioferritin-associated ferredoxin